jgi:hypothetical protein
MATYREHGNITPLDGHGWRLYPQPELSRDPDARLLIQDPDWSKQYQHIPGYSD